MGSCIPNALFRFSELYERVIAIRNIKKGEELCVGYLDLGLLNRAPTIETVRKELMIRFGFDCMCQLCDMKDEKERKEIEKHRGRYWQLDKKIEDTSTSNRLRL